MSVHCVVPRLLQKVSHVWAGCLRFELVHSLLVPAVVYIWLFAFVLLCRRHLLKLVTLIPNPPKSLCIVFFIKITEAQSLHRMLSSNNCFMSLRGVVPEV